MVYNDTKRKLNIPLRLCLICNVLIPRNTKQGEKRIPAIQYLKTKYCSISCKNVGQKTSLKGENNPNYRGGLSNCSDCKKQLNYRYKSVTKLCKGCYFHKVRKDSKGINYPLCINCNAKTGDLKSTFCRKCYRGALTKIWKGGVSTLNQLIRSMPENRQWIKQCMYRDDYTCQECGVGAVIANNLEVHHIKSFAQIIKDNNISSVEEARNCYELWDNDNGMTLCKPCHKLTDNYSKKL